MTLPFTAEAFHNTLGWSMIATGILTFAVTMFISAPYGRYQASKGWGWLIPPQIAWMLMESPNLFMPLIISYIYLGSWDGGYRRLTVTNGFLFGMYQFHYIHRSIVYPLFRINPIHHKAMPISVMLLAFLWCLWNGSLQSMSLLIVLHHPETHLLHWNFGLGFVLYVIGLTINIKSDSTLLSLKEQSMNFSHSKNTLIPTQKTIKQTKVKARKSLPSNTLQHDDVNPSSSIDVSNGYMIPYGDMFEWVSCANYYGEILEWFGYGLACWSLAGWAFAFYTFSNLVPRAVKHHQWYLQTFPAYPKHRKAVIPGVW